MKKYRLIKQSPWKFGADYCKKKKIAYILNSTSKATQVAIGILGYKKVKRNSGRRCKKSSFNKVKRKEKDWRRGMFLSTSPPITFQRQSKSIMDHSIT